MTLRLVGDPEDDELDAIAARDAEPARVAAGYEDTAAPRTRRKPPGGATHWRFIEAEGAGPVAPLGTRCRKCDQPAPLLVHNPRTSEPARTICPKCAGDIRREMT